MNSDEKSFDTYLLHVKNDIFYVNINFLAYLIK